jgi:hypothetical protein
MTCIERKFKVVREASGAWKAEAGAVIGEIADDTIECRTTGQNNFGALEYFRSRKPPTLGHDQTSNL